MIAELVLAASVHAAALTMSVTGDAPVLSQPADHIPCAKIVLDKQLKVFFRVTKDMLKANEGVTILWTPPLGECKEQMFTRGTVGEHTTYRTWKHDGLSPCAGLWTCDIAIHDTATSEIKRTLLSTTLEPKEPK